MSEFSLILVLQKTQENPTIDMVKIQIKSERLTPFGGSFSIMEQFDSTLSSVIDSTLGLRCGSFGYQYSEIIRSLAFLLNQSDEGLAGFRAVGLRLLHLMTCAELVKQAVYQPAAVLQQVRIRWIAYLGVAACGVNFHRTAAIVAVLVGMFLLRLAPVCFRQHQGQYVEEVVVESLADKDEQLWNENRLFRKLLKPKQILHIRFLLNGLDGFLIAQFFHMLHD